MDDADDLDLMIANHRLDLMAASATQSDLDLAFNLQLEEAMAASLALDPSPSPSPPPLPNPNNSLDESDSLSHIIAIQTLELDRFHQEKQDTDLSHAEHQRLTIDLRRRAHDEQVAREIHDMPDEDWDDYGNEFERPMEVDDVGEGLPFRLYFKGMASRERVGEKMELLSAVGVAICDAHDTLLLKIQKALPGMEVGREVLELKAMIEGLNAVISLGIKRVHVFCDYRALYKHVTGRWVVKQQKLANLISQVLLLQRKFESCNVFLLPRCQVKYVFKLARDAIESQITRNLNLNGHKDLMETCTICLEVTDSSQFFTVDSCLHRFCFSCMKQHVKVKLLQGVLPGCPHVGCNIRLDVESSRKFLSPRMIETMIQRIKEASIPATEKVYCPYPKCSALMSINEAIQQGSSSSSKQSVIGTHGLGKCTKCDAFFCINCKVPWHVGMSCYDYKRLNPHARAEDAKLQSLARHNLWRQCTKCNHMIELAEGCFHMTCRCGYEFCYTCGAEWKNKKATCSCPLWSEDFILHDDIGEDYSESDDDLYFDEDEEADYFA